MTQNDTNAQTQPETLIVEYGPNFTVRYEDQPWFQPAGKHGRGGLLPRLARMLQAQGRDPNTPIRAYRNGTQVWKNDLTIGYWASVSASEPDGMSVRLVPYVAMPKYWETAENKNQENS